MIKFAVNPECGFCTFKVQNNIVRVARSSGKMIYKPVLPHPFRMASSVIISTVPRSATLSP